MSLKSSFGLTQEATASQKKIKSWTGGLKKSHLIFPLFLSGFYSCSSPPPYLHHSCWVDANHYTNPSKSRVFFLIISDVSERCAPRNQNIIIIGFKREEEEECNVGPDSLLVSENESSIVSFNLVLSLELTKQKDKEVSSSNQEFHL